MPEIPKIAEPWFVRKRRERAKKEFEEPIIPEEPEVKPPVEGESPEIPEYISPEQAKTLFDVDLEPGWRLRYFRGKYETTIRYVSPEGWEILPGGEFISPQGRFYTEKELEWAIETGEVTYEDFGLFAPIPKGVGVIRDIQEATYLRQVAAQEGLENLLAKVVPEVPMGVSPIEWVGESEENLDTLFQSIYDVGQTSDTEALLELMGATEEQIEEFFPETKKWWTLDYWLDNFFKPYGGTDLGGKAVASFMAGIGDMAVSASGAARWLDYEDVGEVLSNIGKPLQRVAPPSTIGEFEWSDMLDPEFYATKVVRAIPFALSLMPAGVAGFYGGTTLATAMGLGTIWRMVIGGFTGAALSRPAESAFEAGGSYDDAIARGKTEAEAKAEADEVFRNNMILVGADAWEIAIALAPTPKWVPASLIKQGLVKTVIIAGKVLIVGLSEGGEEIYQDMVQRHARGEEWQLDPIAKEVFAIGFTMGAGMGLGGGVISSIVTKSKETMTTELRKIYDTGLEHYTEQDFIREQAELMALDEIAQTSEGERIVSAAIRDVKAERVIPEVVVPEVEVIARGYPIAGDVVDGRTIKMPIPNQESIEATLDNYEVLPDIREVPMSAFPEAAEVKKRTKLADEIEESGEITPLIVVIDNEGAYILEGASRFDALVALGAKSFPAQVVIDRRLVPEVTPPVVGKVVPEATLSLDEISKYETRIPLDLIRKDEPETLARITEEIKKEGIVEPITIRVREDGSRIVWDGIHRLIVAQDLGIKNVPVKFQDIGGKPLPTRVPPKPQPLVVKVPEEIPTTIIEEGGTPISPTEPIASGVVESVPIVKEVGLKEKGRMSRKVFEKLGLYELFRGIQKAEVEIGEVRTAKVKEFKELRKSVGKDKERWALIADEVNEAGSVKGLTFNEKRVVAYVRNWANEWANKKNLPQSKRIKDYLPHLFEQEARSQLDEFKNLPPELAVLLDKKVQKKITDPFLKERLGAVGWIKDPFKAMEAYEAVSQRILYYEPMLQKVALIANDPATHPTVQRYMKDYSRRMTGEMSKFDQDANVTMAEFGKMLQKIPLARRWAKYFLEGNPSGMVSYNLTSVLYTLWLGFKPTSAIRNLSQHTLIIGETAPQDFASGIALRFTKEGRDAVNKHSLTWRGRRAAFVPGVDDSFIEGWSHTFREKALWMFRKADEQNVKDAFLSGYAEAKRLLPNADPQVWYDRGDEVAADTQYLYTKMNSMAVSQNAGGRIFSVLTTWMANWMELMTKWVSRRPSQVYLQYEKATGKKLPKKNWSNTYKAIVMYASIIALAYVIKERERLKAFEYTGVTSLRYLGAIASGDFPGLQIPGSIIQMVTSFLTDDERGLKTAWSEFRRSAIPGIVNQLEDVATGEKDWLTLLFYLEGLDYKIKRLKEKWEPDVREYGELETAKERDEYRESNPNIEAKMFIYGQLTTLSTDEARAEVLRLIEEHDLDTELIKGYEKVFGVDTDMELSKDRKQLGQVELTEEGEQKLLESGELDYYTTSNFASDVNKLEKVVGRPKIVKDGNPLAIEYLEAKDLFVQYESLTTDEARLLFRQQFPDVEAQLYLWGKIASFKNPKSAEILLSLMEKYNIPPESVPAFLENPERYDELFTQKFELEKKGFDLTTQYENYGNEESDIYIEDEELRKEARAKLKEDNPNWVADMRRIEAIDHEASPEIIESWAERGKEIDRFGAGSSEAKAWLLDNPEVHRWALEQKLLTDDGSGWNESVLRINVKWAKEDGEYDAFETSKEREKYLDWREDYRKERRRREAYGDGLGENLIEDFVDYYELSVKGFRQERFLIENPDFAQAMHTIKGIDLPKADEVPDVKYDEIYEEWQEEFERLEGFSDHESKYYIEDTDKRDKVRESMRFKEGVITEFGNAELKRRAYELFFPEEQIDTYADWYAVKRKDYEDDWFLIENIEFYNTMLEKGIFTERRDFRKVPTRRAWELYEVYQELPTGKIRLDFRAQNPELEKWLVYAKGYTPIEDRGSRETDISAWEELVETAQEIEERLKKLRE